VISGGGDVESWKLCGVVVTCRQHQQFVDTVHQPKLALASPGAGWSIMA
jgi:hypothetical protein